MGGWKEYLKKEHDWVQGKRTYFIFDEAQSSYEDVGLWNTFLKNITGDINVYAIAFASYGSPYSPIDIKGFPIYVGGRQRVSLHHIDHDDDTGAAGLLFTKTGFQELVDKQHGPDYRHFNNSFFRGVFNITRGHIGAITDFVQIVAGHDVCFFMMLEHIS